MNGEFLVRASFKGDFNDESISFIYTEVEIIDEERANKIERDVLEMLVSKIDRQPIFSDEKTYLVFLKNRELLSSVEVPEY